MPLPPRPPSRGVHLQGHTRTIELVGELADLLQNFSFTLRQYSDCIWLSFAAW